MIKSYDMRNTDFLPNQTFQINSKRLFKSKISFKEKLLAIIVKCISSLEGIANGSPEWLKHEISLQVYVAHLDFLRLWYGDRICFLMLIQVHYFD